MAFLNFKKKETTTKDLSDLVLGNWIISFNPKYGFVVKNRIHRENYHFFNDSNGWISGEWAVGRELKDAKVHAFNSMGVQQPCPVLVDKVYTEKLERLEELKSKKELTPDEKDELIRLSGLRKK